MNQLYRICAVIDLDAFAHNIQEIRRKIGSHVQLMGVVKADAYGHGAIVLSQQLQELGCDRLAVACVEEALVLRRNGIRLPILILGYVPKEQYRILLEERITPAVFSYETARDLNEAAAACGKLMPVHIKLDTGMGRVGFAVTNDSVCQIKKITQLSHLFVEGLFTHYACADMEDGIRQERTGRQARQFGQMVRWLADEGITIPLLHSANSAATMTENALHMDMVRAGIIMYGLYPSDDLPQDELLLRPVMSLKSHVAFVKTVPAGTAISYGHTFTAKKESRIATIPVGYADGYSRLLSNRGEILIHGQRAPIVGRICMDQFMADVTAIKDVREGDLVTLVGSDGQETISMDDIAALTGTINYEIICNVGKRVPRMYLKGGRQLAASHVETLFE